MLHPRASVLHCRAMLHCHPMLHHRLMLHHEPFHHGPVLDPRLMLHWTLALAWGSWCCATDLCYTMGCASSWIDAKPQTHATPWTHASPCSNSSWPNAAPCIDATLRTCAAPLADASSWTNSSSQIKAAPGTGAQHFTMGLCATLSIITSLQVDGAHRAGAAPPRAAVSPGPTGHGARRGAVPCHAMESRAAVESCQ